MIVSVLTESRCCGFHGSPATKVRDASSQNVEPHLAMTYSALASLLILTDDLAAVNKSGIVRSLSGLQRPNGGYMTLVLVLCVQNFLDSYQFRVSPLHVVSHCSFVPIRDSVQTDMKYMYCAVCISYILDSWDGIDIDKALQYIRDSLVSSCVLFPTMRRCVWCMFAVLVSMLHWRQPAKHYECAHGNIHHHCF